MKKLRVDSKLARLSEEQQSELALYLEGHSLADSQQWLAERGITISLQSISQYYRLHVLPCKWKRMAATASLLNKVKGESITAAAHRAIAQRVFELSTDPAADPEQLAQLYKLMNQGQAAEQGERKLALLEQKARTAEAAAAALQTPGLSEEEKLARVRAIFGLC